MSSESITIKSGVLLASCISLQMLPEEICIVLWHPITYSLIPQVHESYWCVEWMVGCSDCRSTCVCVFLLYCAVNISSFGNQNYRHVSRVMPVDCHCKVLVLLDQLICHQVKILACFQNVLIPLFILILKHHLKLVTKPAAVLGRQLKV